MKLNQTAFEDTVLGAEKELSFSIDQDNPIIFEILRDKMYSNKIGSICREVSSNSRDANREAGNSSLPIEIEIIEPGKQDDSGFSLDSLVGSSLGHLNICFRDRGVGISPDRMENIFVKYAASTKRDTNSQTGGFGLGAKTPFAYTDTFTVVTTCDWEGKRQRFTYTAMIDSSRRGKMILFEVEEVDSPKGTEIIIPINTPQDRSKFEQECRNYTGFWGQDAVVYKNFEHELKPNTIIVEDDDFIVYNYNGKEGDKYLLIIDGVPYPLDEYQVDGISSQGLGSGFCVGLKFDVGQLTISANREAVQYDDDTVKLIEKKYTKCIPALFKSIKNKLYQFDSYIGACIRLSALSTRAYDIHKIEDDEMRMMSYAFSKGSFSGDKGMLAQFRSKVIAEANFQGRKVVTKYQFKHHKFCIVSPPTHSRDKVTYEEISLFNINHRSVTMKKYYGDKRKNLRRNLTIWSETQDQPFMLIIPKGNDDKIVDQMNEMCDFSLGLGLDIEMYGDVEMADNTNSTYQKYVPQPTININLRRSTLRTDYYGDKNNESVVWELNRKTRQFKNKDTRKYLFHIVDKLSDVDDITQYYSKNKKLKTQMQFVYKFTKKDIYFVSKSTYDKYLSNLNIKLFTNAFKSIEKNLKNDWMKKAQFDCISRALEHHSAINKSILKAFPQIAPQCVVNYFNRRDNDETDYSKLVGKDNVKFNEDGLIKKLNKISKKYPLVKHLSSSEITRRTEHIQKYIELFA